MLYRLLQCMDNLTYSLDNLAYHLGIESNQLKARLQFYGIFDPANTLTDMRAIDHLFPKDNRFRARVLKRRVALAKKDIILNEIDGHKHLTYEEIKRSYDLGDGEPNSSTFELMHRIDDSIDSCSACSRRHRFFIDSDGSSLSQTVQLLSEVSSRPDDGLPGADIRGQHQHVSTEEMEILGDLESKSFGADEFDFAQYMDERISSCSICRRQYRLFIDLRSNFGLFRDRNNHEFWEGMLSDD